MHSKSIWRALLLTTLAALAPAAEAARAQPQVYGEDYAPADPVWPFPLYSTHPENGGLYTAAQAVFYHQSNPLHGQIVGVRGLTIVDNVTNIPPFGVLRVPTFIGSGADALDVHQVSGPNDWEPGVAATVGWKFGDGSAFEVKYLFINEVNLHASATQVPAGFQVGQNFENSFLSARVFGFPNDFNGPPNKLATDTPPASSAPGIWNGAGIMTEQFLQRTQEIEATYRMPIYETENYRLNGLVGPRFVWFWERYKWTTVDIDNTGASGPQFTAEYTNIVSNRLYGAHAGFQQECYLGHGFAASLDLQGGLFFDGEKTVVKYQLARGGVGPGSKRGRHQFDFVPELQASLGLMWYPIEGVQIHAGYDFQGFFNTLSSHTPVDFNFGAVDPPFSNSTVRFLQGFDIGIGLIF